MIRTCVFVLLLGYWLSHAAPALGSEAERLTNPVETRFADAPKAPEDVSGLPRAGGHFAASGLSVVTGDRAAVTQFYRRYKAANLVPSEWTGDVPACNAGATSSSFKEATGQQINFFRAMAGVPASISIDSTFSVKDQSAALMMSANGQLSHDPPSSWNCYSDSGAEAAGKSNLALGSAGPVAVTGFMNDNGSNNPFVGHRRWVLYPQTQLMGTGDVTNRVSGGSDANALWVMDGNFGSSRPAVRDDFVAWPPPGYVPYDLVPARWSLSYPNAAFSAATVSVTRGGQDVPVQFEQGANGANGYGENTLIWVIDNRSTSGSSVLSRPSADTPHRVVISGVIVGGQVKNFDYTVTIFDADPSSAQIAFNPSQPNLTVGRSVNVGVSGGSGTIADVSSTSSGAVSLEFAGSSSLKLTGLAPGSATITVTDTGNNKASLTVTVSAAVSDSDWQLAGRADGVAEAMTLVADVLPASLDDGRPGAYFVAAVLPNGLIFVNDGQTWQSYAGGVVPSRMTGVLSQRSFAVFAGLDTRGLTGTQVLVGYGADSGDMLNNARYRVIYTIP